MEWAQLFGILAAALIIWFTFRRVRTNPQLFSKANLGKSFHAMGVLGLLLIAFVAFCIFLLKS